MLATLYFHLYLGVSRTRGCTAANMGYAVDARYQEEFGNTSLEDLDKLELAREHHLLGRCRAALPLA